MYIAASVLAGANNQLTTKRHFMVTNLKNLIRCYATGMGIRSISYTFGVSRNTVRKYVRIFQESGLTLEKFQKIPEHRLQELFGIDERRESVPSQRQLELEALLPDYATRLRQKGVTVTSLFEEYRDAHPDGYRHSSFGRYLQRYTLSTRAVGQVDHYAGDQMYIDYAGDRLEVVDDETGEVAKVEVFVAVLPCSHYTYCEAARSQQKDDLIRSCENALRFFGGAPMAIVPDNLRSAVTRSDRNEPVINEDFQAFADHYGCAVYPARVRHPRDKALVENAVKLMYRTVYIDLEGMVFHDIDSLNAAIAQSLERFNGRRLSGRRETRRELFDALESGFLNPLPAERFQMKERKSLTVLGNSYITLNKHHYSVPREYIGKRVEVVFDADRVDVFHGLRLVTTHDRDDTPYGYSRKESHNLPGHHGSYEKDMQEIYSRAGEVDNILLSYLREVAAQKKYPPQAFRSCRGIMSLEQKFGLERLVAACACATEMRLYGYQEVKEILVRGADADFIGGGESEGAADGASPLQHKNIRGRDYFSKSNQDIKNDKKNQNHGKDGKDNDNK